MSELRSSLNGGRLPSDCYALAEQIVGPFEPDVVTLQQIVRETGPQEVEEVEEENESLAVMTQPPKTRLKMQAESEDYVLKRRKLTIRHSSDDRIVALIELVSTGNKLTRHALETFVDKAIQTLQQGYHLVVIDLFPPTTRDPNGLHGEIWKLLDNNDDFRLSAEEPLVLASYSAGRPTVAYLEPTAIGSKLIDMPLFLTPDRYVPIPLEETCNRAYSGFPKRWQKVLEGCHPS